MTDRYDGDSKESRKAFRDYDEREPVRNKNEWQIWRDACAWQHAHLNAEWMAKCEELRRDAERYRWLRSDDIEVKDGEREIYVVMEHLPFSEEGDMVLMTEDLDDAIDTAKAKKEPQP